MDGLEAPSSSANHSHATTTTAPLSSAPLSGSNVEWQTPSLRDLNREAFERYSSERERERWRQEATRMVKDRLFRATRMSPTLPGMGNYDPFAPDASSRPLYASKRFCFAVLAFAVLLFLAGWLSQQLLWATVTFVILGNVYLYLDERYCRTNRSLMTRFKVRQLPLYMANNGDS